MRPNKGHDIRTCEGRPSSAAIRAPRHTLKPDAGRTMLYRGASLACVRIRTYLLPSCAVELDIRRSWLLVSPRQYIRAVLFVARDVRVAPSGLGAVMCGASHSLRRPLATNVDPHDAVAFCCTASPVLADLWPLRLLVSERVILLSSAARSHVTGNLIGDRPAMLTPAASSATVGALTDAAGVCDAAAACRAVDRSICSSREDTC